MMDGVPPSRSTQVTFKNYRDHPFSQWSLHNVGAILNLLSIPRKGEIVPLQERHDNRIGPVVEPVLTANFADGFLVVQGDAVLYENYFNGLTREYPHIWYSATKSLTSTSLGLLVEEGKVDLSRSPADYIPELKGSGYERTTIQNVLDHCSAIAFKEDYKDPASDFLKYYGPANNMSFMPGARDAQPENTEIYGIHDFLCHFIKPDPAVEPGTVFDYNSANADVAGWLVARISGMPWERFVHERIWAHLGCEHDASVACDRACMAVTTGGMNSTLRDAARFGMMIRNRGKLHGRQIVPAAWVDATLEVTPADRARMKANEHYSSDPWVAYRNMWWILDPEKGEYCAVGIHGQTIYINRAADMVIAFFSSQPVASNGGYPPYRAKLEACRKVAGMVAAPV